MTYEILYRSKTTLRNGWWNKPTLEGLSSTHITLPDAVSNDINQEVPLVDGLQGHALEVIFHRMNNYNENPLSVGHTNGGLQDWMNDNDLGHTSMSMFDVVRINDTYWLCMPSGWEKLGTN